MARRLVLTLALALSMTGTAHAGMTWEYASLVARDHWEARGHVIACNPVPILLTAAQSADADDSHESGYVYMFTDPGTCEVWISATAEWHRTHRGYGWEYCEAVVHEYGHLAGLSHEQMGEGVPFGCAHPRQYAVMHGWRKPPRWVRHSPARIERLWLSGRVWRARVARARYLKS